MRFPWRSHSAGNSIGTASTVGSSFDSEVVVESRLHPGVKFRIAKITFAKRLELMRSVRDLAHRREFLEAGADPAGKMDAAVIGAEIEQLYVKWGVKDVEGLAVDGVTAGPDLLASGPEDLFREALAAVRKEIGLSEAERKNS